MSKTLSIISAFLIGSLIFTSIAQAQTDDFDGFAPAPESEPTTMPITPTPVPVTNVSPMPVVDNTQPTDLVVSPIDLKLNNIRNNEINAYQMVKDNYAATLNTLNGSPNTPDNKLNGYLISARYHKTVELYANYLINISAAFKNYNDSSGFTVEGSDVALSKAEQNLENLSNAVKAYDQAVDSLDGTDISNLQVQSDMVKTQLESSKAELLNLVKSIEQ